MKWIFTISAGPAVKKDVIIFFERRLQNGAQNETARTPESLKFETRLNGLH